MNMAHGNEIGLTWEWDSVLLLANPSLPNLTSSSHSLENDGSTTGVLPAPSADHHQDHNLENCHDRHQARETSSAEHMLTDSISSGSQQMGENQEWRDPRLDCPNFLAGRVPCACTDNDDDDSGVSRKRSKPVPRCQVQSCGAELTNLKGYHQRHRVCLRCAHATRVVLRNQPHRYCQQCGKFHPICDFDEGKRSCRRKLERHNNRRRRKALESEDTLPPLDSGETELRSDSSPAHDSSKTTKPSIFPEEEDKAADVGGEGFEDEATLLSAVKCPGDKLIPSGKPDGAVIASTGNGGNRSLEVLAPTPERVVEEILPTSEPPQRSPELEHSPEQQYVHKKDCHPHPEHVPLTRDIHMTNSQAKSIIDMSSHHIAPRDPEVIEQVVSGHDEESLLALLMDDNSAVEGSGLSHDGNLEVNEATRLWDSSTPPATFSKQANYSSPNPTGRIFFKLYDWNPGDFPRQLRQQVLQWLSQMPVDLEGYIRSGCTILTLFVSMPQPMWERLNADWTESVLRLVKGQDGAFECWNTGYLIARVGQQIVHILNGEAVRPLCARSDRSPLLDGVRPICVEAGVEQLVVMSGSSLHQSESKLLVSFDGTYIRSEVQRSGMTNETGNNSSSLQATIPALHAQAYGTAFIEVERSSTISSFIPLLIAEKKIVDEVRTLEQEMDTATTSSCCSSKNIDSSFQRLSHNRHHDLLVDLGWVLRHYTLSNLKSDHKALRQDIDRLQRILHFGVRKGWCTVVERVLEVAKRAGWLERIGFLKNGMTALHVALLHRQYAVMDHLIHVTSALSFCGRSCRSWWDVDYHVPDRLTARQILARQAKTSRFGSSELERSEIFWKVVRESLGCGPRQSVHHKVRISVRGGNSEVNSEDSEDFDYRALPGETPEYHLVNMFGSTEQEEVKFVFPSVDYSPGKTYLWKSLLKRDDVDTQKIRCTI